MSDDLSEDSNWLVPAGQPWRVTACTRFHDNPWFAADDYDAVAPTGASAKYYLLHFKNWAVGVIPLHTDGTISLVGQWRFPFAAYSWELPEGGQPRGEDPLHGAKRELREEAGLEAADWAPILEMQLSNASSDEVAFLYLATDLTPVPVEPDATEELAVARVPFREALKAATTGKIKDALTVAALLRLYHMAQEGELSDALTRCVLG
jgi:8-oxo-dGTP pyrophosphatase MutT (NUDIX family)